MKTSKRLRLGFQRLKTSLSLLYEKAIRLISSRLPAKKQKEQSNLYLHATELTLDRFIDCLVDSNLNRLIKHGTAKYNDLVAAWESIYSEYCDLSGTIQYKQIIVVAEKIHKLDKKLTYLPYCLLVLEHHRSDICVKYLRDLGFSQKLDWDDPKQYQIDLMAIMSNVRGLQVNLQQAIKEREHLESGYSHRKITRQDFDELIAVLEKYMGFHFTTKELTVSLFAKYKKQYQHEGEEINKIKSGSRKG
jgi:hypothetical protein